jgi:hypothetical protein
MDVDGPCADIKLVPSWLIGQRTADDAIVFMHDLRGRLDSGSRSPRTA